MDEVDRFKSRYKQQIEDGRKIEIFTSMPEWQWYIEHVINPTIQDYTDRILTGKILTDKEDWILRGMIMGIKLVTETTGEFKAVANDAKKKLKVLEQQVENDF